MWSDAALAQAECPPAPVDGLMNGEKTSHSRIHCSETGNVDRTIGITNVDIATDGDDEDGIYVLHRGTGDVDLTASNVDIATDGDRAYGIEGEHRGTGDFDLTASNVDIETSGDVGYGIAAWMDPSSQGDLTIDATDVKIKTGKYAHGIHGFHDGTGDVDLTASSVDIETSGDVSYGIHVLHKGTGAVDLTASSVDIETSGDESYGILGWMTRTSQGDLTIDATDVKITTGGYVAYGIRGEHQGTGDVDLTASSVDIATDGVDADGILGWMTRTSQGDLTIDATDVKITTGGDNANGIYVLHQGTGDVDLTASSVDIATDGVNADGILGWMTPTSQGDLTIDATDVKITTGGDNADGIVVAHQGAGDVALTASNVDIRTAGAGARGIYALQMDKSEEIRIEVDGGSIAAGCQKPEDPDDDACQNTGIFASFGDGDDTGPQGLARVDISRAVVRGDRAVEFKGGRGVLNLADSRLAGNVLFADGDYDDVLSITQRSGSGWLRGGIDFGDGDDALNLDIARGQHFAFHGNIDGLETLTKRGGGFARFADRVFFTGSRLNLEEGHLVVAGGLNIEHGEVVVRDAGKLVFEVKGRGDYGSILARELRFADVAGDGVPFVHVQLSEDLTEAQAELVRDWLVERNKGDDSPMTFLNLIRLSNGGKVSKGEDGEQEVESLDIRSGGDEKVGTVEIDPQGLAGTGIIDHDARDRIARVKLPGTFVGGTGSSGASGSGASGGGSGGGGGVLGLGLLAVLVSTFLGGDEADAGFAEYGLGAARPAQVAAADERGVMAWQDAAGQPYRLWVRAGDGAMPMAGVPGLGVSGAEVGLSLRGSGGFRLSASVAPGAARADSLKLTAEGAAHALGAGWSDGRRFAGLRLSQGDFKAASVVANPAAGGALLSRAGLRVRQAQLRAGLHLDSERLRWTPSVAFRTGSFRQGAHTAQGAALRAEVPAFEQDYDSLQLGLRLASRGWLDLAGGKWRPQLSLSTVRTSAGGARSAGLAQSDRLGALSFTTRAGIRALPRTVSSLSFGASVKASGGRAAWRFGLAGLEADGEKHYAALAGYRLRF